jgi:hypothetical protein
MPLSSKPVSTICLCVAIASIWIPAVRPALADIIYFKDGMRTVCDGKAWEEKDEVRCEHEGGILVYPRADLKSIEKTLPLETLPEAPLDAPPVAAVPVPPAKSDGIPPPAPPHRVVPAPLSMPRPESGLLFYDPRRPKKYWSSETRHHNTFREAVSALATEYDRPVEWVEQHLTDSNDLVEIRLSLEEKLSGNDDLAAPPEDTSQISMDFYNPRRPQPYWTSDAARHTTYASAIQALAREFSETPEWVEAHMGESNDLHQIRRSLNRVKSGG